MFGGVSGWRKDGGKCVREERHGDKKWKEIWREKTQIWRERKTDFNTIILTQGPFEHHYPHSGAI